MKITQEVRDLEVPHFQKGELVATSRRFDERLNLRLLAMRAALAQLPPVPSHSVAPRDLDELIERVAQGPEQRIDGSRSPSGRR